jgi:hypothetical protein
MPIFLVSIRKDAWVNYQAVMKADDAMEACDLAKRAWRDGDTSVKFIENDLTEFDEMHCDPMDDVEEIDEEAAAEFAKLAEDEKPAAAHRFDTRELGTVLAALRHWQRICPMAGHLPEDEIANGGGTIRPLDVGEIDELCERINVQ